MREFKVIILICLSLGATLAAANYKKPPMYHADVMNCEKSLSWNTVHVRIRFVRRQGQFLSLGITQNNKIRWIKTWHVTMHYQRQKGRGPIKYFERGREGHLEIAQFSQDDDYFEFSPLLLEELDEQVNIPMNYSNCKYNYNALEVAKN